jgi:hypothetical protein
VTGSKVSAVSINTILSGSRLLIELPGTPLNSTIQRHNRYAASETHSKATSITEFDIDKSTSISFCAHSNAGLTLRSLSTYAYLGSN